MFGVHWELMVWVKLSGIVLFLFVPPTPPSIVLYNTKNKWKTVCGYMFCPTGQCFSVDVVDLTSKMKKCLIAEMAILIIPWMNYKGPTVTMCFI